MLASRGKKMLQSLQGPSRLFDNGAADVSVTKPKGVFLVTSVATFKEPS